MACVTNLYEKYFGNPLPQGTIFWLGYNTTGQGGAATANGAIAACEGYAWNATCSAANITTDIQAEPDGNPNTFGYHNDSTPTGTNLPANIGEAIINPAVFDSDSLTAGFYGLLHVVDGGNGCCDFECAEIEILASPDCMDDVQITYCEGSLPATVSLSTILTTPANEAPGASCATPNAEQSGGVYSGPASLGTLNTSTGDITSVIQAGPGTYVFQYTVPAPSSSTHNIDASCCSDVEVDIQINIVASPEAGTGSSMAVCN